MAPGLNGLSGGPSQVLPSRVPAIRGDEWVSAVTTPDCPRATMDTVRTTIKYAAPLLATAAIAATIGFTPVASAEPARTGGRSAPAEGCATPSCSERPTPPDVDGVDPLVPTNTGALPDVPWVPGTDRAF